MSDQLSIILSTKIGNTATDISNLNNQIRSISSKLDSLTLNIKINDNITKTLNDFTKAFNDISKQAQNVGKVIEKSILPDGTSISRTYFSGIKGEFSELIRQAQQSQEENEQLRATLDELRQGYDNLTRSATRYNAQQQEIGSTIKATDNAGTTRTITTNSNGDVVGFTDTTNQQAIDKYNTAVSTLKNNIASLQQRMSDLGTSSQHVSEQFNALNQAFDKEEAGVTANINDIKQLTDQYKQLEQEISRVESLGTLRTTIDSSALSSSNGNQTQVLRDYITQAYSAEGATNDLEHTQVTLNSAFDSSGNAIQRYTVQFRDSENNIRQYQGTVDQLSSGLYQSSERITQSSAEMSGFNRTISNFGRQMLQMPIWMASWSLMMAPIEALHSIADTIVQTDTAMTQLKRVMNSGTDFTSMLQKSIELSTQLGSKLTDVLNVETEFARQGFNEKDVLNLTKVASLLVNIGDVTPDQAMKTLTVAMKSFNVTASDSITIADKLNNVSNNYSVDTSTLSDSLSKASSAAKTYGVSLNDLVGMTTAVSESTKESGDVIGNSLKTIFSRISSDASVKALQDVGVQVKDTAGDMRSATDVLGDLASRWSSLTNTQQENIAVQTAGRFQLTRFLALMQNWNTTISASDTALNSQNSALNENQKFQESLQGRLNQLNTAWKQLSLAIGDGAVTDGLVASIKGLTELADAASPVVKVLGAIPILLGTTGVALTLFNTKVKESVLQIGLLNKAFEAMGVSADVAKTAIASTGVGLVVLGISAAIQGLLELYDKWRQKQQQQEQQMQQSLKDYKNNSKEIDGLVQEYSKLDNLKDKGQLDSSQNKEYLDVQQKIAQVLPNVVIGVNSQGKSIIESSGALKENIDLLKQKIDLEHQDAIANAPKNVSDSKDKVSSDQDNIQKLQQNIQKYYDAIAKFKKEAKEYSGTEQGDVYSQDITSYTQKIHDAESKILQDKLDINKQNSSELKTISKIFDIYKSLSSADITWLSKLIVDGKLSADQVDKLAKEINQIRSDMKQPLPDNFFNGMSSSQVKSIDDLINSYKDGNLTIDSFKKELDNSGLSGKQVTDIIKDLTTATKDNSKSILNDAKSLATFQDDLSDTSKLAGDLGKTLGGLKVDKNGNLIDQGQQLDALINTYKILTDMQNNGDQLSKKQSKLLSNDIETLSESYPDLINNRKLNVDAAKKEADANSTLVDAYNKAAQGLLTDEQQMTLAKINQTQARIKAIQEEISALQVYDNYVNKVTADMADNQSVDLARAQAIAAGLKSVQDGNSSTISTSKSELKAYQNELSNLTSSLKNSMDSTSSSTSSATSATDKYALALDKVNEQQKVLENYQSRYNDESQKYRNAIQQEITLLKQKEDILKQQADTINKQIASGYYNSSSSSSGSSSAASGNSTEAQIWNYLAGKGLNDGAIAGIMGNLKWESAGYQTDITNSIGAYGLAQWLGSRKTGLQNYAANQGLSASSLSAQLGYLWKELSSGGNGSVSAINGMSASQAAAYFDKYFERPGSSDTSLGNRQSDADSIYSKYAGKSSSSSGSTVSVSGDINDAKSQVLDIQGQISDIQAQIKQLNFQIVQSKLNEFEATQTKYDNNISQLKDMESRLNTTSTAYRDNINQQTDALKKKQSSIQDEIKYAEKEEKDTNLSAEAHLQLKQKVDQLNVSLADLALQIKENNYAVVQSNIDKYQQSIDELNHSLTLSKSNMDSMTQGTTEYTTAVRTQIDLLRQQQQENLKEQAYLEKEIKDTNLSAQEHQELKQTLDQLTESYADLQSQVTSYYTNLASTITDLYKSAYQDQEQAALDANQKEQDAAQKTHDQIIQNLSDEEDAYQKKIQAQLDAIDQQDSDTSYADDLADKQKAVQDLQNQINVMSLDNSAEGQKKLADLQSQLADAQKAVNDDVSQHESDLRKQNLQDQLSAYQDDIDAKKTAEDDKLQSTQDELNAERDATQKNWDNIINDDEKYTQIQEDIISGHFDNITKDLEGFKTKLESISSDIGDSLTKNLIDQINQAEDAMNKLNGTSASSGSVKSSSSSSSSSKSTSSSPSSKSSSSSSSSTKSSSTPKASTTQYYTVKEGDTLSEIAEKYYGHGTKTYYEKIAKANNLSDADMIKIGQRLKIPSLAVGGVVTDPTLILAGDAGKGNPEIYAPQKLMTDIVNNGLYNAISKMPLIQALNNLLPKVSNNQTTSQGDTYLNVNIANMNGTKQDVNNFFSEIKNEWNKRGLLT